MKFFIVLAMLCAYAATLTTHAQTLNVITKSGTTQIKTADIDSATVQTTTLTIIKKDKTSQVFTIADIQRMTFSNVTSVAGTQQTTLAGILGLLKAYPNPATTESAVEYELSRAASVEAQIVDATGSIVKKMPLGVQQTGKHTVQWDAKNEVGATVASGSYTFIIRTEDAMLTQKVVIIR